MATPAPHEDARLHDAIHIGSYSFPSNPLEGVVKVQVTTGAEIDQQKANGKDRARSKAKGKKIAKVKLAFKFTRRVWEASNEMRLALDPGGVNSGRAWETRHPELADRQVNAVIFTDMGALDITGDMYSFTLDADGWYEPAKAKLGGTKTPKAPAPSKQAAPADALTKHIKAFEEALFGAGAQQATGASSGINSAAESIRKAAAGLPPSPPFQGPEV